MTAANSMLLPPFFCHSSRVGLSLSQNAGLNFAMSLDPKTQMLYEILGSAGLGVKGNLPHPGDVRPATNWGVGGRRRIGCLNYEYFPSKNNPGIPPKDWSTLGEIYYAFPGGNGQYCPNTYGPVTYPCPAFPCWNGPPLNPPAIHNELGVQETHDVNNNTESVAGVADANTPTSSQT